MTGVMLHDFPCGATALDCCDLLVFVRTSTSDVRVLEQLFAYQEYSETFLGHATQSILHMHDRVPSARLVMTNSG